MGLGLEIEIYLKRLDINCMNSNVVTKRILNVIY